ncbi:hypothetical protein H6F90_12760 [Trichocoleus sp. FACHB-591]|uniref:hypothetical protein n=1 Tax=Trichocoleus sp. FACHB-591 TaxID=2692872 RepID=UPI001688B0AF|nr:hypothetical protein [Trichocoleus sp. FACHB-591]MBD2096016.1 hypothetical protein [Trichocoleus sp. FACHB-591]
METVAPEAIAQPSCLPLSQSSNQRIVWITVVIRSTEAIALKALKGLVLTALTALRFKISLYL